MPGGAAARRARRAKELPAAPQARRPRRHPVADRACKLRARSARNRGRVAAAARRSRAARREDGGRRCVSVSVLTPSEATAAHTRRCASSDDSALTPSVAKVARTVEPPASTSAPELPFHGYLDERRAPRPEQLSVRGVAAFVEGCSPTPGRGAGTYRGEGWSALSLLCRGVWEGCLVWCGRAEGVWPSLASSCVGFTQVFGRTVRRARRSRAFGAGVAYAGTACRGPAQGLTQPAGGGTRSCLEAASPTLRESGQVH